MGRVRAPERVLVQELERVQAQVLERAPERARVPEQVPEQAQVLEQVQELERVRALERVWTVSWLRPQLLRHALGIAFPAVDARFHPRRCGLHRVPGVRHQSVQR